MTTVTASVPGGIIRSATLRCVRKVFQLSATCVQARKVLALGTSKDIQVVSDCGGRSLGAGQQARLYNPCACLRAHDLHKKGPAREVSLYMQGWLSLGFQGCMINHCMYMHAGSQEQL